MKLQRRYGLLPPMEVQTDVKFEIVTLVDLDVNFKTSDFSVSDFNASNL